MSLEKVKILICGGGNGAHCLAGIASSRPNVEVKVLTVYENEAERWSTALRQTSLKVSITDEDGSVKYINSGYLKITDDPAVGVDGVDIIFIVVPSYVHQLFLNILAPFIQPNTLIVGLPGHAGFELQCKSILKEKVKPCAFVGFESLPWACRIVEYGKQVQLLGYKDMLGASFLTGVDCNLPYPAIESIQNILGDKPRVKVVSNVVAVILMAGSIIHPPILYGKWKKWDGMPLKEKPLFYQGVDDQQVWFLSTLSDEVVATAKKVYELRNDLDMNPVLHIFDWMKAHYPDGISDKSTLMTSLVTNKAYNGLLHPMQTTEMGFIPDFTYRYLSEDVPFGLVVIKGIAELVDVATPTLDEIIIWAQAKLGKEYIVGEHLKGRDVKEVRAPQSCGIESLVQLIEFVNSNML